MLEGDVLGFYNLNETSLVVGRIGVGSGKSLLNLHVASGDLCYHTMIRVNEFEKSKSLGRSYLAVSNIVLDIKIEINHVQVKRLESLHSHVRSAFFIQAFNVKIKTGKIGN